MVEYLHVDLVLPVLPNAIGAGALNRSNKLADYQRVIMGDRVENTLLFVRRSFTV